MLERFPFWSRAAFLAGLMVIVVVLLRRRAAAKRVAAS
jgi:hypothetical protein